ncbi:MAG: hypothetical protein ACO1SX_06880 [Actinomycetota bacterium]
MVTVLAAIGLGLLFLVCAIGGSFAVTAALDAIERRFGAPVALVAAAVLMVGGVSLVAYPLAVDLTTPNPQQEGR